MAEVGAIRRSNAAQVRGKGRGRGGADLAEPKAIRRNGAAHVWGRWGVRKGVGGQRDEAFRESKGTLESNELFFHTWGLEFMCCQ